MDNGQYTVQSAYRALKEGPCINTDARRIWKLKAPPRMLIFGWLTWRNKILTHDNLNKKGMHIVTRCTLCKEGAETVRHLFKECPYAVRVYIELKANKPMEIWPRNPVLNLLNRPSGTRLTKAQRAMMVVMQFVIWKERCARSFTENTRTPAELIQDVLHEIQLTQHKANNDGTRTGTQPGTRHNQEANNTGGE